MLLQHNKHVIGHEEHSNNSVKSILLPGKVEGKKRHEVAWNTERFAQQQDTFFAAACEIWKNWKVGGEYAKDKEWFVKKNVSSFLDVCVSIHY